MKLISDKIRLEEIKKIAYDSFGDFIKAVVDVEKEIMVIDAELHSDEESLLLQSGSRQSDLWGINIYPDKKGIEFIEFDSLINIRPRQENLSRDILNKEIRESIIRIVNNLIVNE